MINETIFQGSSQIGEILLLGVEEIIGQPGLKDVLNLSGILPEGTAQGGVLPGRMSYAHVTAATGGLERMYGARGGRGIALRAGRAGFQHILHRFGGSIGLTDLNYRLLPVPERLKTGLEAMAGLMGEIGDESVTISADGSVWNWASEHCPFCWQRTASEPSCLFTVGLLQEFFTWASSGRVYSVREVGCRATGGEVCLVQIEKRPLD